MSTFEMDLPYMESVARAARALHVLNKELEELCHYGQFWVRAELMFDTEPIGKFDMEDDRIVYQVDMS